MRLRFPQSPAQLIRVTELEAIQGVLSDQTARHAIFFMRDPAGSKP
jgi:hypothetical protein